MEQSKYLDVVRLGHRSTQGVLNEGDQIVIQEKIDGANASFKRDGDTVLAFSRNNPLDEDNTLRGFYQWTQTLDAIKLLDGVIYFGEWSCKHKIAYAPENTNQFFLYDIYNTHIGEYVNFSMVRDEASRLNLNLIPLFYEGEYQSFEHLQSFVGKSILGDEGEGIVVKNVNYKDRFDKQVFVKLVSDAFREVQKQKAPKDPSPQTEESKFVSTYVTEARVEKFLHKLVDESVLDEQFGIEDMGLILKNLNIRIYEDLLKEESDSLPENCEQQLIRKAIGRVIPNLVKSILNT